MTSMQANAQGNTHFTFIIINPSIFQKSYSLDS